MQKPSREVPQQKATYLLPELAFCCFMFHKPHLQTSSEKRKCLEHLLWEGEKGRGPTQHFCTAKLDKLSCAAKLTSHKAEKPKF